MHQYFYRSTGGCFVASYSSQHERSFRVVAEDFTAASEHFALVDQEYSVEPNMF
jgi:hypothetical protein